MASKAQHVDVDCPAQFVSFFDYALARTQIPAGVTYNADGSRHYSINLENHSITEIHDAIRESVKLFQELLPEVPPETIGVKWDGKS